MPRIVLVNAIPAGGLSMRIVFGIALALLVSPASGETLVERGAYLVNSVMVCHNCHTPRGPQGLDISRALSGGSQDFDEPAFKVTGSNITPDKDTGIGNWSDAELKQFLVSGIRPNGTGSRRSCRPSSTPCSRRAISTRSRLILRSVPPCVTRRRRRNTESR